MKKGQWSLQRPEENIDCTVNMMYLVASLLLLGA